MSPKRKVNSFSFKPLSEVPELLAEFSVQKNDSEPESINVNSGSTKKYWWQCENSHEWEANMRDRFQRNNQCPYCAGRLATPENNLIVKYPEIAELFDKDKNGVLASEVTPTYNAKMHFTCPEGHRFLKSPKEMIRTNGFCLECTTVAFKYPELRDFYHPNNEIAFESLRCGASQKVKWICDAQHEYEQSPNQKIGKGLGCPFCSGRYATKENNLLLAYPDIAQEFDSEKSGTSPDKVTPKSNRNMWWNCPKGHSYETTPAKKTREDLPYGCPFCSGYQIDETNSFGNLYPELAKEFLEDVNGVDPYKVTPGRSIVYQWKCEKEGHLFKASISDRTRRGDGCPFCSGRYATPQNNFATVRPDEVKHFHPTKNDPLTPFVITPYSNKKIHWICEENHEWVTTPGAKMGCSQCSLSATSKIERMLRQALNDSGIMKKIEPEGTKLKLKWRNNSVLTVDILASSDNKKFAIEYDGYYFHSGIHSGDKKDAYLKDAQKSQALLDAGYHVVRIRERTTGNTLDFIDLIHPNFLQLSFAYPNRVKVQDFTNLVAQIDNWIKTR